MPRRYHQTAEPVERTRRHALQRCVGLVLFRGIIACACACERQTPQASPPETTAPVSDETSAAPPQVNSSRQSRFDKMATEAEAALTNENWILATQLVRRGLDETTTAGRDYEKHRALFLFYQAELKSNAGQTNDARRFLGDALAIHRVHDDNPGIASVEIALAALEDSIGDLPAARRHLESARKHLTPTDAAVLQGRLLRTEGNLEMSGLNYELAATAFLEASRVFEAQKDSRRQAHALVRLSTALSADGKTRQSERHLKTAVGLYTALGDETGKADAMHRIALLTLESGNHSRAREQLKQVQQLYTALGRQSDATKVSRHISSLPD